MSDWTEEKLGKNVSHKKGFAFKSESFQASGYPVIKVTNFTENSVSDEALQYVDESTYNDHIGYRLGGGDVVIQTVGSWPNNPESVVGRVIKIPRRLDGALLNQNAVILYPKSGIDPSFFYYLLQSNNFKGYIINTAQGAANQASITLDSIFRFEFYLPNTTGQKKIAAILSTYDELIENNNRRIALLEKLAEEIYREWFVRLRFPGHGKVKKVKGVPEGWKIKRISEIVDFLSGYSFKSETYTPSGRFGVVTIKNVQEGFFIPQCTDFIDEPPTNMKEHCVLNAGDVLMSLTGNVGRVCHVYGSDLLLNQRVAKLRSKLENGSQFLYYTFNNRSMIQLIENLSLGSTAQMNLSPIQLGKQKLVVPDSDLLLRFENAVSPLKELKLNLHYQCENLRNARNRLLPRLISGKLSVENLDIRFPPGMSEELEAIE